MITREQLIENCERGIVKEHLWRNRDTAEAQKQLGVACALLKAGCEYSIMNNWPFEDSTSIEVRYKGFRHFDYGGNMDRDTFYIPTKEKLDKVNGNDWY